MQKFDDLLRVADALSVRARRFSKAVAYEAGVSETLESVASLLRDLAHAPYRGIDRDAEVGAAAAELRRIAAQLEVSAVEVEYLTNRMQRWGEHAVARLDLPALDSAARALMEAALRIDSLAGDTGGPIGRRTAASARHDANYLAALALALMRADPTVATERLVGQLRDAADQRADLLVEAATRLAHEHDTTEEAAARAIEVLERAAGLSAAP